MMAADSLPRKGLRYLKRWVMLPHRLAETLQRMRDIEAELRARTPAAPPV